MCDVLSGLAGGRSHVRRWRLTIGWLASAGFGTEALGRAGEVEDDFALFEGVVGDTTTTRFDR